jgi:spore maturation protein CgeB
MLNRVLHVGYFWPGSTCVPRLNGLRSLGLDVETFDATGWYGRGGRIANAITHRVYTTPSVWAMNRALIAEAARVKPDVVWLEKGDWVFPSTLGKLRDHARFLVHYNTDDVFGAGWLFWLHRRGIRRYDLHLTTNRWNVRELRGRYGVRTLRAGMGYDQDFHRPVPPDHQCSESSDVVFVGHWEPHTERYVSLLRDAGVRIHVWGYNWWKAKDRALRVVTPLEHGKYLTTIASAKMALCVLSRQNRNESTGRSFEIPAIGICMIAERTAEHVFLYGEEEGAVLFSEERELVEKARRYLGDDKARVAVACAGHARCNVLGMSWGDHIRREWPLVEDILRGGRMAEREAASDHPFWAGYRDGEPFPGEPRTATGGIRKTGRE